MWVGEIKGTFFYCRLEILLHMKGPKKFRETCRWTIERWCEKAERLTCTKFNGKLNRNKIKKKRGKKHRHESDSSLW